MPQQTTSAASSQPAASSQTTAPAAAQPIIATESKVRTTAFFALVLIVAYLITGFGVFPLLLLADFALRGFGAPAYSPLGFLAGQTSKALKLQSKPVYMPPKRFAARVGFVFCLAITILHYAGMEISATLLGFVIGGFAALESLAGFCAGCYVYNAWARLRTR